VRLLALPVERAPEPRELLEVLRQRLRLGAALPEDVRLLVVDELDGELVAVPREETPRADLVALPDLDHVMAVRAVQAATGATFHLHTAELPILAALPQFACMWLGRESGPAPEVDGLLVEGEHIRFGDQDLETRFVPGHSPGSIAFIDHANRQAFVGDTLFAGSIGRTDLPGGDYDQLIESITAQLLTLPDDYRIWPGHGGASTIGREKATNPFLLAELGTR